MEICLTLILLSSTLTITAADSVRLVDGGSRCAGRVEVLHDGHWGTVCGDDWDMNNAAVVCRELRCGEALNAPKYGHFGPGSGPIWMVDVSCNGSESTLKDCGSRGRGELYCGHVHDAGVTCSGQNSRLSAGPHRCSGRVEVFHGRSWYTVCDADFDQQDAEVVCREIDCGIPVKVLRSAAFGRGEGQVWTEELQCRGNESDITFCPTSSSLKHSTCSHDNDLGLICSGHTEARLVNGPDSCSGRVELLYLGVWGTVCAVSWNMRAADVLCAQLDCGSAVAVVKVDWFGEGSNHTWADVFDCQGKETHLSQCGVSSWSRAACSHKHDIGVICNGSSVALHEGRVRLSGGSECQGEVEIYFRQDWRRVLLDSWTLSEASVLCRQLGCGSVLNYRFSPSTTEHKHMCVTGFSCSGSEDHLRNCSSAQAEPVNCSSGEQLYITCSDPSSIRLVGSRGDCAGRLEVFHSGSWGTVRDDLWGIEDVQVVCRQLQCGEALSNHIPAWFGPGTGSIWMNEVECEGNETSLWNCRYQLCEEGECGHHEDVGVVCSEFKEIRLTKGCEGNLEVFYNGTWGNVCYNQMDDETANMVCGELNCGRRGSLSNTEARVKSAPNWLDHVICRKHDSNLLQCPSSPWGQNRCDNHNEVVHITCTDDGKSPCTPGNCSLLPSQKPCSKHWSLRLSGGKGSCSGRLEVYHNSTWGSVCDDQWNIMNVQVVCRQLGCGSALSADDRFGFGEGTFWLNRVKCRGDEIHLWDCHHSLKNHTDCSPAGVTCADISTVSTAKSTTKSVRTDLNPVSPGPPSSPPLVLYVLGTLLFLALVLLLVLFYQNRVLRKVYEEINHRYMARRSFTQRDKLSDTVEWENQSAAYSPFKTFSIEQRKVVDTSLLFHLTLLTAFELLKGATIFTKLELRLTYQLVRIREGDERFNTPTGHYEYLVISAPILALLDPFCQIIVEVDASEHQSTLPLQSGIKEKAEYYDDVMDTSDIISDPGRVDPPEDYIDAVTVGRIPDNVDGVDAITADQKSVILTEDVSENYDDAVTTETNTNIITDNPEDYDDVITEEQDVGETEEYDDVEGKSQKDRDHVTETCLQRPFVRKLHFNFYKHKK
ncbi:scavenger receptor cysteine-rich type 1 protein M130-like [Tachysurus fulvidraco]|uniref:scavenger receptor cysteine-rich type 1 protein M130-like n=1 Tax=Tachysurus fulvidraco TaxID=1234273 RepID=UPI001FED53A2|nr:scavenger receptor cysteine-rich type 1 protein M130-like [Tachysurus fulvidraco]